MTRSLHLAQGVMGKTFTAEATDVSAAVSQGTKASGELSEGVAGLTQPQLISRGAGMLEEINRAVPNGSCLANGLCATNRASSGSTEQKSMSPPRTPVTYSSGSSPLPSAGSTDSVGQVPKYSPFLPRAQHLSQASELYYQDGHSAYDNPQFPSACSFYPSTLHAPHKPCMARFLRSSNVPESSLPPSLAPTQSSFANELQAPHPPSSSSPGYAPHPLRDRIGHPAFHTHPGQPHYSPLAPAHGVYAPLYDSRRVWRPQLYHREDARSNSLPPEVLHSTVYQPPLRERFNSLDNYCSGAEHRVHRDYGRVPLGYEDLFRRKQEQWAHHHHHHNANRPSQSSPIFTIDFGTEREEGSGSPCMGCRFRGEDSLTHYSPWSCGSIGPCLSSFEPDSLTHSSAHTCSERVELNNTEGGCSRVISGGVGKPWLHSLDHYRRLKDDDPIIPFSEGPIISKWGAISRASRTGYHTTDPIQATACQGSASTTAINFRDYNSHLDHSEYKWTSRGSDSSSHSSFLDSEQLCTSDLQGRRTSISSGEKIVSELQSHQSVYGLNEERLSESEPEPDRDIELELCALDMEDSDQQDVKSQDSESVDLASPQTQDHLHTPSCYSPVLTSPLEEHPHNEILLPEKIDPHLLKKMAFRKSLSPGGLVSGGLGVGKLVLRAGPPHLGDTSSCACSEMPVTEVLLNGS